MGTYYQGFQRLRVKYFIVCIQQSLAALRPDGGAISAGLASHQQDETRLLREQALQDAQAWAAGKHLGDGDFEFLAASQALDKRTMQTCLEAKEQTQGLAEAKYKANWRMRVGAIAKVLLVGAFSAGFAACQSPLGMATNRAQNEPLGRQPAVAEQNLLTIKKQGVNGVRERIGQNVPLLKTLKGHNFPVNGVSFSPDRQTLASVGWDNTVKLWKRDGTLSKTLKGHDAPVMSVSFSPDGQMIASGDGSGTIKLWKRDGTLIRTLRAHTIGVTSISFSPDGQVIVSGSGDKTIKLWKRDGTLIKTLRGDRELVFSVRFSPDGQMIASGGDKTIKLWKRDGTLIKAPRGHTSAVNSVRFSPDGQMIASDSLDKTIRLWKRDGTLIKTLKGYTVFLGFIGFGLDTVSFSPDGQILASGGDKLIRLRKPDGTLITTLRGHTEAVWSISFSPDGQTLASGSADGTIKLWDLTEVVSQTTGCGFCMQFIGNTLR